MPDDVEDLVQEGRVGLILATRKYDPARGKFSTYAIWWVRRAVLRVMARWPRADEPRDPNDPIWDQLTAPPAEAALEAAEVRSALEAALRRLPPREALVLRRRFLDGLTLDAVGRELGGITREAVRQVQVRALARARRLCPRLEDLL